MMQRHPPAGKDITHRVDSFDIRTAPPIIFAVSILLGIALKAFVPPPETLTIGLGGRPQALSEHALKTSTGKQAARALSWGANLSLI